MLGEIGGELKYGVTSGLTLDLTYNTDFAQVEVDDQQINLDRFSLFFPEKRPFFLAISALRLQSRQHFSGRSPLSQRGLCPNVIWDHHLTSM